MIYSSITLLLSIASLTSAEDFVQKAEKLFNKPEELVGLYKEHKISRSKNEKSELDSLFSEMHQHVIENQDDKAPRHVVTILSDDQGWADIGYNDASFVTPTSDFLAAKGSRLDSFYVQSSCSPTRASLLTGRYVTKTGLQDGAIIPGESRHLPTELPTSAQYFKDAGYSTYLIGKWHLGARYVHETPNARGFDYFFGILGGGIDYYGKDLGLGCGSEDNNFMAVFANDCKLINAYDFQENGVPYVEDLEKYSTDVFADKVVESIVSHDPSLPMFMHFHPTGPHTPMQTTPEMYDICEGVSPGPPETLQPYYRQQICGMTASVDLAMLRMLLALASRRMLANTLITYSSDNGGLLQAGSSNTPFRSQKGSVFEGGVHVPAFMFGNGLHFGSSIQPIRSDLMHVSDILPTLLGYAGISTENMNFDGYNFWPRLSKGLPLQRSHVPLNSASKSMGYFSAYIQTIFGTTWKYLLNPSVITFVATSSLGDSYEPEGEFLFNLSEDPMEQNNLVNDTSLQTIAVLNLLRARTLALQASSTPSQMKEFPPPINTPPSVLGCWLPLDSPYYSTFTCPVPTPVFPDFQQIMADGTYNQYVTSNLDL